MTEGFDLCYYSSGEFERERPGGEQREDLAKRDRSEGSFRIPCFGVKSAKAPVPMLL